MKKVLTIILYAVTIASMEPPRKPREVINQVPNLRTLCLQVICLNKMERSPSSNNLVEQVEIQENVYDFYISRGLTANSISLLKLLLENNVRMPEKYRIIPALFQKWPCSPIKKWKAASVMEPFTHLLHLVAEKQLATREEFFDALNVTMKEECDSYALAEFLIQKPLQNDLGTYPYGNIAVFPPCNKGLHLELKQFLKIVIGANICLDLKNSMLRRAVHQKIAHGQEEYEPIIACLLEHGADKTILSPFEQSHLTCADKN